MKHCYLARLSSSRIAIADLTDYYDDGWYITRINVPKEFRGQGHGRALLKQITDAADQEGVTLHLEIQPSDGLDYEALQAWYIRAGFKRTLSWFTRRPKQSTVSNKESATCR